MSYYLCNLGKLDKEGATESLRLINVLSSLVSILGFQPLNPHKVDIATEMAGDDSPKWTAGTSTHLGVLKEGSGPGYLCSTMLLN